jgi:hypothetical protein
MSIQRYRASALDKKGYEYTRDSMGPIVLHSDHAAVVRELVGALQLRKTADIAWKSDHVAHDTCHQLTQEAQRVADELIAKYKEK